MNILKTANKSITILLMNYKLLSLFIDDLYIKLLLGICIKPKIHGEINKKSSRLIDRPIKLKS